MDNSSAGDNIKDWLDAEVRKARIAKARNYLVATNMGQNYLRYLDDQDFLLVADRLENTTGFLAGILRWNNCGRLPVNLKKYRKEKR